MNGYFMLWFGWLDIMNQRWMLTVTIIDNHSPFPRNYSHNYVDGYSAQIDFKAIVKYRKSQKNVTVTLKYDGVIQKQVKCGT